MKQNILRQLMRMALLLLGSAILGTVLLVLIFLIPTEPAKVHITASVNDTLNREDVAPTNPFLQYVWLNKETYTDAIMVQNTIEDIEGKNAFEHAMMAYHNDLLEDVWSPENSLRALVEGKDTDEMFLHEYSRYWHGYLIYLKPLLTFIDWSDLVILGVAFQILLMARVVILSIHKKHPMVTIAMLAGFLYMKPVLVLVSFTMTVCWVITLLAILVLLLKQEKLDQGKWLPEFFLVVGIATAYFDFLTYPLVTLGFPICTFFLLKKEETLWINIKKLIGYCGSWGIGYVGMWAMKWVIADVTLHTGTIKDAIWSIIGRTEAIGGRPRFNGGFYVIGLNLQEYGSVLYPIGTALAVLCALVMVIWALRRLGVKRTAAEALPLLLTACMPFVWIIIVQHHSALHARFTFRILSLAILALAALSLDLWTRIHQKGENVPQNGVKSEKKLEKY